MSRFTKIGADGAKLPDDATEWVAALDNTTQLIWTVNETARQTWKKAQAAVKKLDIAGFTDWRLPTIEELFLLADRTRHSPAIDTAFFPDCKSEWYWTSTPSAFSPGVFAWIVFFDYGSAFWCDQGSDHYVRAVRASQF
jgi:hypothetical protein